MVISNYPLCCYRDGQIIVKGEEVSYVGGYNDFVFIHRDITFSDLVGLICDDLGVDTTKFKLELKLKFPCAKGFKVISLNSDRALMALWASVEQSNAYSMDIYMELIECEQIDIPHSFDRNTSFVNLLNQAIRGDELPINLSNDFDDGEDEDMLLSNNFSDNGEDLVSLSAPNSEFCRVRDVVEQEINCLCGGSVDVFDKHFEFMVQQVYKDKEDLTQAVILYSIKKCQTFRIKESRSHTITFKCSRTPTACAWSLRASKKDATDAFTIITYKGPHKTSCVSNTPLLDHPNLNAEFISKAIKTLVATDWGLKPSSIIAEIKLHYKFTISYMKAWNSKQKAISSLFGDWEASYELLPRYFQALQDVNPGTKVHFVLDDVEFSTDKQFDKVFWAFGPSIRGFKHCRPVLTIDGTHLYGKYKGVLLIAMGVDANEQLFPLAFAIVDGETLENWSWFLACIRYFVTKRQGLCVISDRHKSIVGAINEVGSGWEEPHAYHRYCIRHHESNINTTYKCKKLKSQFSATAHAHEIKDWESGMKQIELMNVDAKTLLDGLAKEKWSMAHDGGYRYGICTSNLVECFNGVLKNVRFLPIHALVQATFHRVNSYFVKNRDKAQTRKSNGDQFSERIARKLAENSSLATQHNVQVYNREMGLYGVMAGPNCITYVVNFSKNSCTCNKWQIYHYPCSHVMAVCSAESLNPNLFVDPFFSCDEYSATYNSYFHPVPGEPYWKTWTGYKLVPNPTMKRGGGRPQSSRIPNEMDESSQKRSKKLCSICNGKGHNKRTCPLKASTSGPS